MQGGQEFKGKDEDTREQLLSSPQWYCSLHQLSTNQLWLTQNQGMMGVSNRGSAVPSMFLSNENQFLLDVCPSSQDNVYASLAHQIQKQLHLGRDRIESWLQC